MIKIGNHGFQVVVQPLTDGGFAFAVVDIDLSDSAISKTRYDSQLRFETENEAYDGGSAHARRRAAKLGR
jgi:hypothetical protein